MTLTSIQRFIKDFFRDFVALPQNNNLGPGTEERAWDDYALGYASAEDELWAFWKQHIGDFHWTPAEAFALRMSDDAVERGAAARPHSRTTVDKGDPQAGAKGVTVVSWALSHTESTKADNRRETRLPSERWARSRVFGQKCNRALHRALVAALAAQGYEAVAPGLLPEHGEKQSPDHGRASNWSERHVAHTAGLGTFSLCGGLITPLGQAVRLGSIVVGEELPPTRRPYTGPFDYCLHYNGGACTACADRCPVGSVSTVARDKALCGDHLEPTTAEFVAKEYGFRGYGCGLCQTGVPCESGIPSR